MKNKRNKSIKEMMIIFEHCCYFILKVPVSKVFFFCDKKLISINQSVQYCEEGYFISKLDVEFLFSKNFL